jgi:murein DD-endopeptidase MepM/ murein hydrolase activator NlpD
MDSTNEKVSAKTLDEENATNSQSMPVLQAAVNRELNSGKTSEDIALVSGNSLVAEIGPSGTVSDIDNERTNTQISLYTVREGDTLSMIADMFDVTVNTIIWANDLSRGFTIKEGQKLVILPISGINYTVKKGDTIRGIVKLYKTDLNEVLQYNDLTISSVIMPGDTIVIPDAEPYTATTPKILAIKKTSTNPLHDADGKYFPGYYIRPIVGGYKSQDLHGYNAVDLAASLGTPIRASAAGIVIASVTGGYNGGYGNYAIISHSNGSQTLYAHTQKNFVSVGDSVEQGQMIAKLGSTGRSTGPHIHFEIRGAKNPF